MAILVIDNDHDYLVFFFSLFFFMINISDEYYECASMVYNDCFYETKIKLLFSMCHDNHSGVKMPFLRGIWM